jgi:hypothetical protein
VEICILKRGVPLFMPVVQDANAFNNKVYVQSG